MDSTTTTQNTAPVATDAAEQDVEAPQGTPAPAEPAEDTTGDQGTDDNPGREAARYRRQLRDTEAERDQLTTQIDTLRRGEVERLAATELDKPGALWTAGVELGDLLDTDGLVDPKLVTAAVQAATEQLGLRSRTERLSRGNVVPKEGGNPRPLSTSSSWEGAFKP